MNSETGLEHEKVRTAIDEPGMEVKEVEARRNAFYLLRMIGFYILSCLLGATLLVFLADEGLDKKASSLKAILEATIQVPPIKEVTLLALGCLFGQSQRKL